MIDESSADWRLANVGAIPPDWVKTVEKITGLPKPEKGAQLLWIRGIRQPRRCEGFWETNSVCASESICVWRRDGMGRGAASEGT